MQLFNEIRGFFLRLPDQIRPLHQRLTKGFPDSEVYDLNAALVAFMLPRLRAFKKMKRSTAFVGKIGNAQLDAMIWSFENWEKGFDLAPFFDEKEFKFKNSDKEFKKFKKKLGKGFILFGELWPDLSE
jgi:hypothetical protein